MGKVGQAFQPCGAWPEPFLPHNLFWITLFIGTVFASSWGPVGLMSIWSQTITARGARWGMLAGLLAASTVLVA